MNYSLDNIVAAYPALFLDNDGTCAKTEELHAEVGASILCNEGNVSISYQERYRMMGLGEYGIWDLLDKQGRTPAISKEDFKNLQAQRFIAALHNTDNPHALVRPGIPDLVKAFKDAGKPVIIVSNTSYEAVIAVQNAIQLKDQMDAIITFEDIQAKGLHKKPSGDPYFLAKSMLGIDAKTKCLVVEDSQVGVKAGMDSCNDVVQIYYMDVGQIPDSGVKYSVPHDKCLLSAFENAVNPQSVEMLYVEKSSAKRDNFNLAPVAS